MQKYGESSWRKRGLRQYVRIYLEMLQSRLQSIHPKTEGHYLQKLFTGSNVGAE